MRFSFHKLLEGTGLDTLFIYYYRHRGSRRDAVIEKYRGADVPPAERRRLRRLMRYAFIRYGWNFDEFFMMNFESLSHAERKDFVPEVHKAYFCQNVNPERYHQLFADKGETYVHFKQYYHREVCKIRSWSEDGTLFTDFAQKHNRFIVKPLNLSMGQGVHIVENVNEDKMQAILDENPSGIVAEELISQSAPMAALYPMSVNTVRLTTFLQKDGVKIVRPFMRVGRGGNVVDNGGKGGLICALDRASGKIIAVKDEMGASYQVHPDTGHQLIGFQVPRWDEAVALAEELSQVLPACPFVGWDLALTDEGWVMVEGNSKGMFIGFQLPTQKGFRTEFEILYKNMKKD